MTPSRPSINQWSYVTATTIFGQTTICPSMGLVLDCIHTGHGGLTPVDGRCAGQATEYAIIRAITNRVSPTRTYIHREILKTNMAKVPPAMASSHHAPLPSSPIPFSISRNPIASAFLGTGVMMALSSATATLKST